MGYVDKKVAMQYLANSEKMFQTTVSNFLKNNANFKEAFSNSIVENDLDLAYQMANSIKNVSLRVGSQTLYDDANEVVEAIKKGTVSSFIVDRFLESFDMVYFELSRI